MLRSGVGRERGQILYKFADILEVRLATVQMSANEWSLLTDITSLRSKLAPAKFMSKHIHQSLAD